MKVLRWWWRYFGYDSPAGPTLAGTGAALQFVALMVLLVWAFVR